MHPAPRPLADLPVGHTARVQRMDVDDATLRLLRAIGLTGASELRICKNGDPCIVQVRSTRIGLSSFVARHILVVPEARQAGDR